MTWARGWRRREVCYLKQTNEPYMLVPKSRTSNVFYYYHVEMRGGFAGGGLFSCALLLTASSSLPVQESNQSNPVPTQ